MEEERTGTSFLMKALAVVVLLIVGWFLLKVVIGVVAAVAWVVVIIGAIIAAIWAFTVLRR